MGKNKIGGKGHKKKKNNTDESSSNHLILIEEEQNYGKIIKSLGSCRFDLIDSLNKEHLGIVRGNMRKKIWIKVDDIVIFSYRSFQDNKVDIIHKYKDCEIPKLIEMDQLTSKFATTTVFENESEQVEQNKELENNNLEEEILFDDI